MFDLFHVVAKYGREVIDRVRVDRATSCGGGRRGPDPGSPFVWDALGATPSIRLPRKSANHSESAGAQKVEKADKAAPPAGVVEARTQSAQATH